MKDFSTTQEQDNILQKFSYAIRDGNPATVKLLLSNENISETIKELARLEALIKYKEVLKDQHLKQYNTEQAKNYREIIDMINTNLGTPLVIDLTEKPTLVFTPYQHLEKTHHSKENEKLDDLSPRMESPSL